METIKKSISKIVVVLLFLTMIVTLLSYLGDYGWFFDLWSHFKVQYLTILLIGSLILLWGRKWKPVAFCLPFLILNAVDIVPLYSGGNKDTSVKNTVKINCINVLSSNQDVDAVVAYLNQTKPDIVVFLEFNATWEQRLDPHLTSYSNRILIPRTDNFGIAVYSKIPLTSHKERTIGNAELPSILISFKINNRKVQLLATHPLPPMGKQTFDLRNNQLKAIARLAKASKSEFILMGDLNTSSYSTHFKRLIEDSNLKDSRKGFGILATWPTWFSPASITLDHCLVSKGIVVKSRKVGEFVGSDHLPIFIEIGVK